MRLLVLVAFIIFPAVTWSETITVRSGDHAGFSRLAFDFSRSVKWAVSRTPEGYKLRFSGDNIKLDVGKVFKKITRKRIAALTLSPAPNNAKLDILLACDCHAEAFEVRSGLLVVDIKDGPPVSGTLFEKSLASVDRPDRAMPLLALRKKVSPRAISIQTATPVSAMDRTRSQPVAYHPVYTDMPSVQSVTRIPIPPPILLPIVFPRARTAPLPLFSESPGAMSNYISAMKSDIVGEIGRAATDGLLNVNITLPKTGNAINAKMPKPILRSSSPTQIAVPDRERTRRNLRVHTSIERDAVQVAAAKTLGENGEQCLQDSSIDIAKWGKPKDPMMEISKQRSLLTAEFDKVNPQAVEQLAKAYIYAGFGAEARAVLSSFDVEVSHRNLLRAMAEIMDTGWASDGGVFKGQADCDSAAALWAVLAVQSFPRGLVINTAAVKLNFSGLPLRIRQHLGPLLAQRFLDAGDKLTAEALRNAIIRAPGAMNPKLQMLNAHLESADGKTKRSETILREIVAQDNAVAAKALAELLERRLSDHAAIKLKLIESAEAQAFEMRGTKIGRRLLRVAILGRSQSGDYSAAIKMIGDISKKNVQSAKLLPELWGTVLADAASSANDADFLIFAFKIERDIKSVSIKRNARRLAAKRLFSMGFPDISATILSAGSKPKQEDRLILAEIALEKGDARRALRLLKTTVGKRANQLRAKIYAVKGDFKLAEKAYESAANDAGQRQMAWKMRDWNKVEKIGTPREKRAAALAMSGAQSDVKPKSTIGKKGAAVTPSAMARSISLLDSSRKSRKSIDLTLAAFP